MGMFSSAPANPEGDRTTERIIELQRELQEERAKTDRLERTNATLREELNPEMRQRRLALARQNEALLIENGTLRTELDAALKRAADMTDLACRAQDRVQQLLMGRTET